MSAWNIRRYESGQEDLWNRMVSESRNGTFLLNRGYMDYHSDRFDDCSWIAYKGDKAMALLPANLTSDGVLHSHQGLTYGGWLLPKEHLDGEDLLAIFEASVSVWKENGIKELDYKSIPFIYSGQPSEEDNYSLFRMGAVLTECNISSAVNLREPIHYNKLRRRQLTKAQSLGAKVYEVEDAGEFMGLVSECLQDRHSTHPVHTATEIELLQSRFPENIKMYGVSYSGGLHAGVMIFDTGRVAHAQYIATTALGRDLSLLSPLFHWLMTDCYSDREYFDFGISNEDHGRFLNEGLLRQKFSYGATGVSYNRYSLKI